MLIARALPWSLGLMLTALLISWTLGNFIGLLAGYHNKSTTSKAIETAAMIMYPIPYYILALLLVILFAYIWPIFPFVFQVSGEPGSWQWMKSVAYNSFLPLMAIVTVSLGWWIISMKAMAIDTKEEDFRAVCPLSRRRATTRSWWAMWPARPSCRRSRCWR